MMKSKFIGAGMSRRVFSISTHRCQKVPVEGREEAAILQNRAEAANIQFAVKNHLKCFPVVYSVSSDGMKLTMQKCQPVQSNDDISMLQAQAMKVLQKAGFNQMSYANCTPISTLMFALGAVESIMTKCYGNVRIKDLPSIIMSLKRQNVQFSFFYNFHIKDLGNLLDVIFQMKSSENMLAKTLKDLLKFTFMKKFDFALEDLWNVTQWGIVGKGKKRFIVLDAGFSRSVQNSGHYTKAKPVPLSNQIKTTMPEDNADTFNGESLYDIHDPAGNIIKSKFFTSKMSEYILSSANMSRRIKKAGLQDDGLHAWNQKLVFIDYNKLVPVMQAIQSNMNKMMPTKIESDWSSWMKVKSIGEDGNWYTSYEANGLSADPVIGKHVLEFNFDGDNVVRSWHPGHDVSYIQEIKNHVI